MVGYNALSVEDSTNAYLTQCGIDDDYDDRIREKWEAVKEEAVRENFTTEEIKYMKENYIV